jgi:glycosyltransferase involved in cell wall biosynthesis
VRYASDIPKSQLVDGIKVIRLPQKLGRLALSFWSLRHWPSLAGTRVVHSHDLYLPFLRKLLPGAKWVHTFHGFEGYPLQPEAIAARQQIRAQVKRCIAVGHFIEKWYGTKCDAVIYGAVDHAPRTNETKQWDGLFLGRLEEDTGFKEYFQAMQELCQNSQFKFAMAGSGSLAGWARAELKKSSGHIEMLGQVADSAPILARSRVAFVSGYLAILEAAYQKRPVVAFYNNPLKEDYLKMHPFAKSMFIAGSTEEIESCFQTAITDHKDLTGFADWAEEQTWSNIAKLYAEEYEKA